MISVKFLFVSLLVVGVSAHTPNYLSPLLVQPGNNAGQCLTAASNSNGAQVSIQPCTGADSQQWTFDGGSVKLFGNSKCLDVIDGVNTDGTKLQIWDCSTNGNPNQQFYYTGDYRLAWTDHGKCVDLTDGNDCDGSLPQVWTCGDNNQNQVWNTGYHITKLPNKSQDGQSGTNNCGTGSSQDSQCQTAWINGFDDFCLWGPPQTDTIGNSVRIAVAWCTKSNRGTRTIPDGTLQGVHFIKTPDYVQVTGVGNFTKLNIPDGDEGAELSPHGVDGKGNPIGGLVYGNTFGTNVQYHEWTSFISHREFCFRACTGPNAAADCDHAYSTLGCRWSMPANYDAGVFESCDSDSSAPVRPPPSTSGTTTWYQPIQASPAPAPSSSNCQAVPTVCVTPVRRRRGIERRFVAALPTPN